MIELMVWGSCVCAIISILVALRCIYIEHPIRTYADNDFKALNDTKIKFSDTTKLYQKEFPKSAKKYKRNKRKNKRHG